MQRNPLHSFMSFIIILIFVSIACTNLQPTPIPTNTPEPSSTATETVAPTATQTPRPSATPRPTQTPNLTATKRAEERNAEAQKYFEKGYLVTIDGKFRELEDFSYDWAQLGFYRRFLVQDSVDDFFLSAHFKWDSAFRNSDTSGCGFIFDVQPNNDHYAVFLDRQRVLFLITDNTVGFSKPVTPTRGTGIVKFDYPAEADFTLIVKGAYAYVLVNGEVVGEYTLSQSRPQEGAIGLTVLSGTNRDFGTHCEMTNLHLWQPR